MRKIIKFLGLQFTNSLLLVQTNGEFDYVKAGEPAWGHEVDDQNVWYFNGTPASCVAFALKYVLPKFFNNMTIDLVVSGPNEGTNMGQGFYTGLGTMGATYNSIYRGIPGVAFSGSNSNNSFFKDSLNTDPMNPSNIYASKVVEFVAQIFKSQGENPNALPITSGINVNFPPVGNQDTTCTDPEWVLTRMSGELSATFDMAYNETSNTFVWSPASYKALTVCENGDCSLPSANEVLTQNCRTAVSVFSIDYDAKLELANEVKALVQPILSI